MSVSVCRTKTLNTLASFVPFFLLLILQLAACGPQKDTALGTLEWDRIALPAPVAEKILQIQVREGQHVVAGQLLLALDPATTRAKLDAAEATMARQAAALEELNAGPRVEEIERAKADLAAAQAEALDQQLNYRRLKALGEKNYASRSDIDAAKASAESGQAQVRSALEQLLELQRGNRPEDIEQGEAALMQARFEAETLRVLLEKLSVRAPRAGIVDSIPFKLGDEAPIGAALVVMLTGDTPYARVYVPQSLRRHVQVGGKAQITLEGLKRGSQSNSGGEFSGRVRMVRNEPSFTPYYALTGDDVTRLSYIAEIQLQEDAARLPAGLPLRAVFIAGEPDISGLASPQVIVPSSSSSPADTSSQDSFLPEHFQEEPSQKEPDREEPDRHDPSGQNSDQHEPYDGGK